MSPLKASEAQLFYANLLNKLSLFGFLVLLIAFFLYISGILGSYVPLDQVSYYWTKSSHHFLVTAKIQPGWAWVGHLNYGDFLVYLPISILAGATIVCYIGVIFKFLKTKEYILVAIAILEVLVLSAAASGVLKTGGH
jgi:hypothetical protein